MIRVLITGCSMHSYDLIRALKDNYDGEEIYVVGINCDDTALLRKGVDAGYVVPRITEESYIQTVIDICKAAKESGTIISYDLNYRPSLWKSIGGQAKAQEVNRAVAPYIDVMIGNEEDFTAALGFAIEGVDENLTVLPLDAFKRMVEHVAKTFPNFQAIGTTMRSVKSATVNDWSAIAWTQNDGVVKAAQRDDLEIFDRVGGGDSFASGLIYGLISGESLETAVNYGAAHGALAQTTPGDTSMATLAEVKKLAGGGSARVDR